MKAKKGVVTNCRKDKTIVVSIDSYRNHPKYKKRFKVSKKFHVHNPENKEFAVGETILFYETKPISKLKKWTIVDP
ncbi:MAG: 30S ribosomal protein S17, partial [Candidatus Gracilibacteria bacterium]